MTRAAGACPGPETVERLADGVDVDPDLAAHLASCESCRARVEDAKRDAAFLRRVSRLSVDSLGPAGAPRLPGYRVQGVISTGAQGVVYKAVQEATSRAVAIKTLIHGGEGSSVRQRARAEREAEIAARLRHPNIVTVYESRTLADGRTAVVMEFVDGVPLDQWTPPGDGVPTRRTALLRCFASICHAIHHAHLNGVIHRDLKPANILVTGEGRPVVLDFGVAKAGGIRTTVTGEFAGTPAYASPEQAAGRPDAVDALTDVYSLGVILYRLLCGTLPYELEGSLLEIARTIATATPAPPSRHDASISPDLSAVVLRALSKEKESRYHSAAALARDVERVLAGEPVEARSASGWYLLRKAVAVNRGRLALAGVALAVVLSAGLAVALSLSQAAESSRRAAEARRRADADRVQFRAVTELLREALPTADPQQPELANAVGSGLARLYLRLETGDFASDPAVDQAIRRLWGQVYTGLGAGKASTLVPFAEASLRSGLESLRARHPGDHPEVAATLHELAGVLLVRQRYSEALPAAREALAMRERLMGQGSPEAAMTLGLLARIELARGHLPEARARADAALDALRAASPGDPPGGSLGPRAGEAALDAPVVSALLVRARSALREGDPALAERDLREALRRGVRSLSPDDPDLLALLTDAAEFATAKPEAELTALLARAWSSTPGSLPAALRGDATALARPDRGGGLMGLPIASGRTEALARLGGLQAALLGPHDPAIVRVLMVRVRAAEAEGLYQAKGQSLLAAADVLTASFGPADRRVLVCLEEASLVFALSGEPDEAVRLIGRADAIRAAIPQRDPMTGALHDRYLAWFHSLGAHHDEAERLYTRAQDVLVARVGSEHHTVAFVRAGLAYSRACRGELDAALPLSREALSTAQRLSTTAPDQLGHIRVMHAHVLTLAGRHAEALPHLEAAWPVYATAAPSFTWRVMMLDDALACARAAGDEGATRRWTDRREGRADDPS